MTPVGSGREERGRRTRGSVPSVILGRVRTEHIVITRDVKDFRTINVGG